MIKPIAYLYVKHSMEEEKYISDKFGRRNPFTVPEGYFEQLTAQVMNQLPERRPKARRVWMRPVWWAAAAVCALFVSTAAWLVIPNESKPSQGQVAEVIQQSQPDDAYFDAAADYVMLDNQEIYACLSDY
jgi:4-amino-4-deoxy-L-arabinose transferase-like glycosyltransferase